MTVDCRSTLHHIKVCLNVSNNFWSPKIGGLFIQKAKIPKLFHLFWCKISIVVWVTWLLPRDSKLLFEFGCDMKMWFAHEDWNHGKHIELLLIRCFPCLLYTIKFTKVGLVEKGETGSRLEMDGVSLLNKRSCMQSKTLFGSMKIMATKTVHSAPCCAKLEAVLLTPASTVSSFDYLNIFMSLMNYFVFASKSSFPYL